MANTTYTLNINSRGSTARFIVVYKSGSFFRLEKKAGKLSAEQWSKLMLLVPQKEIEIQRINSEFVGRVEYVVNDKPKPKTVFTQFMDEYFDFYHAQNDIIPRINVVEGKALKGIIKHLQDISSNTEEALVAWKVILSNWNGLEEFYAKQMELKHINANISTIIRQVKDGTGTTQAGKASKNYADDLRGSL